MCRTLGDQLIGHFLAPLQWGQVAEFQCNLEIGPYLPSSPVMCRTLEDQLIGHFLAPLQWGQVAEFQ